MVFPLTLQPLTISRAISIESVNRALASDRLIFLPLQTTEVDFVLRTRGREHIEEIVAALAAAGYSARVHGG